MTDPMLTAGVRRIAQARYPSDWEDRVMVANIAANLELYGFSSVHDVPVAALDKLFADNTFAVAGDEL